MPPNLLELYSMMLRSRLFEEAVAQLWRDGLISGEMHLGTGEEGIVAGVVSHLREGDAMALDHRGTPPLIMRGVSPVALLREMLGLPDGLCGGMGGHMHLFSKEHLAASSGIVGAAGPAAVGFALAAEYLRPGNIAVAFFGDAAVNQGMLMEAMNLAAVWKLPVLFVCKDDTWGITTPSENTTSSSLEARAHGLGLEYFAANGQDVAEVWWAAGEAIEYLREGRGPVFFHAGCVHLDGHFLGYQLHRVIRDPLGEGVGITIPLVQAFTRRGGAPLRERVEGIKIVLNTLLTTLRESRQNPRKDPLSHAREALLTMPNELKRVEDVASAEIAAALEAI